MRTQIGLGPGGSAGGWTEARAPQTVRGDVPVHAPSKGARHMLTMEEIHREDRDFWFSAAMYDRQVSERERQRAERYRNQTIGAVITAAVALVAAVTGWAKALWPAAPAAANTAAPPKPATPQKR